MKLKNNVIDLTELALGILILGIVTAIGAKILITQRDSRFADLPTYTKTNESITFSGNTATLANRGTGSVVISNQTTGTTLNSGNYTTSIDSTGVITVTNLTNTWQPWYATYTASNVSQADWALANSSAVGIAEYGNWFKTIVIVGVAAVVLSLIFMAFGRGSSIGGGNAEVGGNY